MAIFLGVGFVSMALGRRVPQLRAYLAHDPLHGQHYGIIAVELGVLVTVFGVMVSIFYAFAGRRRIDP